MNIGLRPWSMHAWLVNANVFVLVDDRRPSFPCIITNQIKHCERALDTKVGFLFKILLRLSFTHIHTLCEFLFLSFTLFRVIITQCLEGGCNVHIPFLVIVPTPRVSTCPLGLLHSLPSSVFYITSYLRFLVYSLFRP